MSNTCLCGHKKTEHEESKDQWNPNRGKCKGIGSGLFGICYCTKYERGNIKRGKK